MRDERIWTSLFSPRSLSSSPLPFSLPYLFPISSTSIHSLPYVPSSFLSSPFLSSLFRAVFRAVFRSNSVHRLTLSALTLRARREENSARWSEFARTFRARFARAGSTVFPRSFHAHSTPHFALISTCFSCAFTHHFALFPRAFRRHSACPFRAHFVLEFALVPRTSFGAFLRFAPALCVRVLFVFSSLFFVLAAENVGGALQVQV